MNAVLLLSYRKGNTGLRNAPRQVPIDSRDPCGKGEVDKSDEYK